MICWIYSVNLMTFNRCFEYEQFSQILHKIAICREQRIGLINSDSSTVIPFSTTSYFQLTSYIYPSDDINHSNHLFPFR